MNKIKSFFMGIILLAITLAAVFIVVLTYRANEQVNIETYIFQMGNKPNTRIGNLQDINDMKPEGLRNKLIQKYVSEYFKVIPGTTISNDQRTTIMKMSNSSVYQRWLNFEAKSIEAMAKDKMFRNVWVDPTQIQQIKDSGWFMVPYFTRTWPESNNMAARVVDEAGIINLKIRFKPGIIPNINVRTYLEKGENPAGLFMFQVTDVRM